MLVVITIARSSTDLKWLFPLKIKMEYSYSDFCNNSKKYGAEKELKKNKGW